MLSADADLALVFCVDRNRQESPWSITIDVHATLVYHDSSTHATVPLNMTIGTTKSNPFKAPKSLPSTVSLRQEGFINGKHWDILLGR